MEIYRLAKFIAKFSSILLEVSDFYLPPMLPLFSSSNWTILRSSREFSKKNFTRIASVATPPVKSISKFQNTEFYDNFTDLLDFKIEDSQRFIQLPTRFMACCGPLGNTIYLSCCSEIDEG